MQRLRGVEGQTGSRRRARRADRTATSSSSTGGPDRHELELDGRTGPTRGLGRRLPSDRSARPVDLWPTCSTPTRATTRSRRRARRADRTATSTRPPRRTGPTPRRSTRAVRSATSTRLGRTTPATCSCGSRSPRVRPSSPSRSPRALTARRIARCEPPFSAPWSVVPALVIRRHQLRPMRATSQIGRASCRERV